jgi:hypothetical protein
MAYWHGVEPMAQAVDRQAGWQAALSSPGPWLAAPWIENTWDTEPQLKQLTQGKTIHTPQSMWRNLRNTIQREQSKDNN